MPDTLPMENRKSFQQTSEKWNFSSCKQSDSLIKEYWGRLTVCRVFASPDKRVLDPEFDASDFGTGNESQSEATYR